MPGRIVRSQIAERVATLLGSRQGRNFLSGYGWQQGMPVVMAEHSELLDDVMGLVSVHEGPVMVAMLHPQEETLLFLHVSEPSAALEVVNAATSRTRISQLFTRAQETGRATFRVKYWKHSAVAHAIPAIKPTAVRNRTNPAVVTV